MTLPWYANNTFTGETLTPPCKACGAEANKPCAPGCEGGRK